MNDNITDLSKFGFRELDMAAKLLQAMADDDVELLEAAGVPEVIHD